MPRTSEQQRGVDFEIRTAETLGGALQPRSGANWFARSDVRSPGLLTSCKAEAKRTWAQTREQLREAIECAAGTGDLPALAILDDDGEQLIVMRLADHARLRSSAPEIEVRETRADRIRRAAAIPQMLRGES
jgi:hypothetical protein